MKTKLLNEYSKILNRYMKEFGFEPIDIAYLAKVNIKTITTILAKQGGIELESLEAISQIFGLRYYQFGNPNYKIVSIDSLPDETKSRIMFRKKDGKYKKSSYDQRNLNEKIIIILCKYDIDDEFLSEHIVSNLFETFKEKVKTSEVSKRLVDSLNEYVLKTNNKYHDKKSKGRKPYYFKLVRKLPAQIVTEAKNKISIK